LGVSNARSEAVPKIDSSFNVDDYAPVADRIALFYMRFPSGRILTEMVSHNESEIIFKAVVYRTLEEREPSATGWASERIGDGDINTVACLENTETSAIGRALANLGLTAARARPSLEEMTKATRARLLADRRNMVTHGMPDSAHDAAPRDDAQLQHAADRITDALRLLTEAERAGLSAARASELRARLLAPDVEPAEAERIERRLRRYLAMASARHGVPYRSSVSPSA
jgi:hypothetical protein